MSTIVTKNTQYTVRPDTMDTATIDQLNNEEGVIVWDKDLGVLKRNNGSGWDTILASNVDAETLKHFKYNPVTDKLEGDRAIETTLNSLFLGEQHKMSSGAENIFFTNLGNNTNFYPMWGGLKDQSLIANQGADGFIPPSGRVYSDMFNLPLGGSVAPLTSIGYSGSNYFGVNIAGLGITTTAAEDVPASQSLVYELSVNGRKVYKQILPQTQVRSAGTIYAGDLIEWWFDHPVEIHAGTTIFAEIRKVDRNTDIDYGVFQVREGDELQSDGNYRYQAIVHNRLFEDKDLELISPYLKYKTMDFGLDATGSTILVRDLSLGSDSLLVPHAVNTLQAVANGSEIQIKIKDGAKVIIESLPVSGISIDGSLVNSVMNQAVVQLNEIFTNTSGFISPDTFVNSFTLSGNDLTLGLNDGVSYTVDVTSLGVDENNFVSSGSLSGSDLVLTMDDATTVTIDASSLAVDENTTITFGTLANNLLTLNASDSSTVTIDVSALAVDENLFVESGFLDGTDLELTMSDTTVITVGVGSLAIDNNTTISSGTVSGTDIILSLSDASVITIDASTLGGTGSSNEVVSGSVVGDNLVLVMSDASEITIDASNMINGASLSAVNDEWFISYGANANIPVGQSTNSNTQIGGVALNFQGPYYYGQALTRGSEFKFNFNHSGGYNFIFGIWSGPEEATQFGSSSTYLGQLATSNWSTGFRYQGGFQSSNNTSLTNTRNSGSKYVLSNGMPLVLRFSVDGHLTLFDVSDSANEVEILTTQSALSVSEFNVQMGVWANGQFFNTIISESNWEIVHDFDSSENGIFNGIEDHTVLRSGITVVAGEKIMFDLDRIGSGEFFGTSYTGASSGNASAETQLVNSFEYRTNEALTFSGVDWTPNTAATNYFLASGTPSWRVGGSNNTQGMFSIRFQLNNVVELWSETENELIATSLLAGNTTLGFYMGSDETMTYNEIPTVTKQSITQGTQPNAQFKPTVANQTASVIEGEVLNFTIVSSDNIVNQFVEVDAPSWITMNQSSGVLSGTAPSFVGSAADTIIVACKVGNAIGGTVDFTVTVTVVSYASTNTKSLDFSGSSASLQGPHANVTALQRASNGSGSSDAWTISMWVKPSTASNVQTLFYYGGDDLVNEGRIEITQFGGSNIMFKYGSTNNNITIFGVNTLPVGQWNHVMISYDGAATTNTSTDIAQYVTDRFTLNVNGSQGWNSFQHVNYGYTGSIIADKFRIGRLLGATTSQYMLGGRINQIAIWDTDERANLSTIYNGGATQDLSLLASAPSHYYEIENSITTVTDLSGNADLTGYNFVNADLVTDAP